MLPAAGTRDKHGVELAAIPREWLVAALLALAAVVALQWVARWLRRLALRSEMHARLRRATEGEREAAQVLDASGFAILGAQVPCEYSVLVDGESFVVGLRADYIVAKDGRRYVAEVKTGALAPRLDTAATRRQLLEYGIAFDVDGVLLVDAESRRIHTVVFPTRATGARANPRVRSAWSWFALATVIVVVVAIVRLRWV